MSFEIVFTDSFYRKLKPLIKKYSSIKQDLTRLRADLQAYPTAGDALGRDCYKVRMRIEAKGKGKSGGARVITCVKVVANRIYLLTIYDKSEQASIPDREWDELLRENGLL
jgi:mRNA-degrading endonuclease RelE of RelBE toxin-antitoxin system